MSDLDFNSPARIAIEATKQSMATAEETIRQAKALMTKLQKSLDAEQKAARQKEPTTKVSGLNDPSSASSLPDRALRMPEMQQIFGIGDGGVRNRIKRGLLPRPVKFGLNVSVWWRSEIEQVIAALRRGAGEAELKSLVADIEAMRAT